MIKNFATIKKNDKPKLIFLIISFCILLISTVLIPKYTKIKQIKTKINKINIEISKTENKLKNTNKKINIEPFFSDLKTNNLDEVITKLQNLSNEHLFIIDSFEFHTNDPNKNLFLISKI